MCSACSCVWRLSYVADNCNIVATEHSRNFITFGHGRYGLSFMCKTVERAMLSAVFF